MATTSSDRRRSWAGLRHADNPTLKRVREYELKFRQPRHRAARPRRRPPQRPPRVCERRESALRTGTQARRARRLRLRQSAWAQPDSGPSPFIGRRWRRARVAAGRRVGEVTPAADRSPNGPRHSDNLICVRRLTATEAARRFSDLLDQVERDGETFLVERRGRAVASIGPAAAVSGRVVKDFLRVQPADAGWTRELAELRAGLEPEVRSWNG
jgi:antitoxin (DNA-binding transcriptional repressor) of toxin-antitoxin stability system